MFLNALINWQKVSDDLPENIYVFIRKALPNNTNLLRWKKVDSALCILCKKNNQTQLYTYAKQLSSSRKIRSTHVASQFQLYTMCHYLSEFENVVFKLYADLFGFKSPIELFNRLITDNVLTIN